MKTVKVLNIAVATFAIVAVGMVEAATPAQLYLKTKGNPSGFIFDSSPRAIKFASPSETSQQKVIPLSDIKGEGLGLGIVLEARGEALANGRAAFAANDYRKAAGEFRAVAEKYKYLINIPNNFATEAKFYEIECYKRAGAYKAIAPALESPVGKTISFMLGDRYKQSSKMHQLWGVFGTGDIAKLEEALAVYQMPVNGDASMLPSPSFKAMPHGQLSQVAYMRAKLYEQQSKPDLALQDYYKVITLGQAYDPYLTKQAIASALKLQSADKGLASSKEATKAKAERKMQSLAYTYVKRFPGTSLPSEYQSYATSPKVDLVVAAPPEKEAAPEKEAEGEMAKGDAKMDEKKTPEKPKKPAKKKGKKK